MMKRPFLLNTLALLTALLCALTANAYDFEVEAYGSDCNLYFNILSDSTVELASCMYNGYDPYEYPYEGSYNDEIFIPSQVTHGNVNYTIVSIGNRAFYGCHMNRITLPETILSIGSMAFKDCPILKIVTCLALTPPNLDESFDSVWILIVKEEAYDTYVSAYENYNYFSNILCISKEEQFPIYYDEYDFYEGFILVLNKTDNCRVFQRSCYISVSSSYGWGEYYEYHGDYFFFKLEYYMLRAILYDCFAIVDDKYYQSVPIITRTNCGFDRTQMYKQDYSWNIDENNIYYSFGDGYSNHFDPSAGLGVTYHGYLNNEEYGPDYRLAISLYSGDVAIPEHVHFGIWDLPVTAINIQAFAGCVDLKSVTLPNTITSIDFTAFYGCTGLNRMTLPVSISYIDEGAFYNCNVDTVILTGEGEWQGGALPDSVKTLLIGNGVTGVKGMQVNPETIYCYATTPPVCDDNSFIGYDGELHVPASSLAAYFTAPYWCNFTNIIGDAVPLTNISLNNDSIEVLKGDQVTIRATLNPANAMPNTITWSSSDESVAKVENGVVTALSAGQCDITATCQDKRAVCHVKVTEILPTSVSLNQESAKMEIGSQLTLTATVMPEDATDKTVSWRSSNQSVATVDENGVVTAVGTGECDITAYCRGKQAVCHVTVVEQFIYISLDQHEASVLPNHIIMLTPTVSPVSTDLVVTSSNPAVAAVRLAGNRIQVVGVSEGEATIVVNSADGYAFADSCQVRVYTERGDVNGDGFVDIADVSALIDYLLGGDASEVNEVNADTDANGDVSIADVSMLIDYLLGSTELPPKEEDGMVEYTVNGVTFKMVKVDGGTFTMGATEEEDADYQVFKGSPKHQVTLSKYWIGQTEVTQKLWAAVMGSNPSTDQSNLQYPVNSISWEDCATFISQLNQLTGKQFRLPTEAEWEYAAKGGTKSMGYVYSGSDNLDEVAWFSTNSESHLHQVGTKKANELGLYDMCGNIDEWCNDWYSLYTAEPVENPTGPETGMSRIHRGGRWNASAMYCRLTRRDGFAPGVTRNYLGLRLALTE